MRTESTSSWHAWQARYAASLRRDRAVLVLLVVGALLVPITFLGPGTDLDTGAVLAAAAKIRHGDYVASRPPGAPVHEAMVGLLDGLGGTVLSNLGSLAMAVLLVSALVALLRRGGIRHPELAAAFVAFNPWFLVAATSTVDFVWAVALVVCAAVVLRRGSPLVAGVLAGLAVGCRMSTVLLVVAIAAAELGERPFDRTAGPWWRRPATFVASAAVVSVLCFVPPFLAAGRSLAFAQNDFRTSTPLNHLGRAAAKDLAFFGPFAVVLLVAVVPFVLRALRAWRASWLVRFGVVGLVLSQGLFVRFPWKMGHLLPTLVCTAVLLAVALDDRRRWLLALVVAQAALGFVNVELLRPDNPNDATAARVEVDPRWGVLVTDTECRADDPNAYVGNDRVRLEAVWNCAKPFGTGHVDEAGGTGG